ncbi:hypothetical protein RJ640_030891 [Escallonia rubra]|uniref:Uncharacterized protein n=1 Tax=Escallonia rubra TaxID=112253 RepID=A0AA88UQE7_9ASTE|nr:hypothetical protein RJ640_030891 [Escallonia rubra]
MRVEGVKKAGEELGEKEGEGGMGRAKVAALVMVGKVAVEEREMKGRVVTVAAEEAVVIEAKEVIEARGNSMVARGMKGMVARVEVGAKVAIEVVLKPGTLQAEVELPIKLAWHKDSIAGPSSQSIPSTYDEDVDAFHGFQHIEVLSFFSATRCPDSTWALLSIKLALTGSSLVILPTKPYLKPSYRVLHAIDLDLAEGYEWPAFMYDMAARPGESKFLSNNRSRVPS